ncbi:hypothetical protein [Haladaptatus sp.]|uniref:hypothetical protein n=1 Tax=Haladaptatus sp. TaxID=1973141 RepID=UPI003C3AD4ED
MNRRRFLALTGFAGSLAGCIGRLPFDDEDASKPVSLRVRNYFEERRVVTVTIKGNRGKKRYKSDFYLFPGWVANRRNILEAGTYKVNVQLDNGMWRTAEWTMEGCDTNVILVDAGQDGVGITSTCQKQTTTETETSSGNETMSGNETITETMSGNETTSGNEPVTETEMPVGNETTETGTSESGTTF